MFLFTENTSLWKVILSMLMFGVIYIPVQGSLSGLIQSCLLGVDWANRFISEDLLSLGVQCDIDHFWSSVHNGFSENYEWNTLHDSEELGICWF